MSACDLDSTNIYDTDADKMLRAERALIRAMLQQIGYTDDMNSLTDLYATRNAADVNRMVYELLHVVKHPIAKTDLVGMIGRTSPMRIDADLLKREFDETPSESLRWRIADTFDVGNVEGVGPFILEKLRDPNVGRSKSMLLLAAARHCDPGEATKEARRLFDEWPVHAAIVFWKVGTVDDLAFVHAKLGKMEADLASMTLSLEAIRGRKAVDKSARGLLAIEGRKLKDDISDLRGLITGVKRETRKFERRLARDAAKRARKPVKGAEDA